MNYKIIFPIGDWSDDGHGKCEYFTYESNKPVNEVREAHYRTRGVFGFLPSDFANEYGDSSIPEEYAAVLTENGFQFDDEGLTPAEMAEIWVFMLMQTDTELKLDPVMEEDIPMIVFYGYDESRRHIDGAGYGLFEGDIDF